MDWSHNTLTIMFVSSKCPVKVSIRTQAPETFVFVRRGCPHDDVGEQEYDTIAKFDTEKVQNLFGTRECGAHTLN